MASSQSSVVAVRAGLVYQAVGLNEHLKIALRDAGVNVVIEILANALSLEVIQGAKLDVFVVNLDPELEDSLEALTDMLDQVRRPVIFNDGAASSGLSGWDQARWARHLAAKITGELDATPPRPLDAQLIKSPPKVVKPIDPPIVSVKTVPAAALAVLSASQTMPVEDKQMESAPAVLADDVFAELNFDFDATEEVRPNQVVRAMLEDDEAGLADFDASAFDLAPEAAIGNFASNDFSDFDALFKDGDAQTEADASAVSASGDSFAVSASGDSFAVSASGDSSAVSPQMAKASELSELSWSLEPIEGELVQAPSTGRAVFAAKELPVVPMVPVAAKVPAVVKSLLPTVAEPEGSELADFDFFLESDPAEVPALTPGAGSVVPASVITKQIPVVTAPVQSQNFDSDDASDFDALFADLNDLSPVSMPSSDVAFPAVDADMAFDSASLDFDLDFEVGAPTGSSSAESESDFADLDALFADSPVVSAPQSPIAKLKAASAAISPTGPERVFVLGASIGGPEAVRSFLSKLKPKVPAAFVLAQHMGAEFLELMTSQLAKASSMPVRLAKPGEVFAAGEIVVVPVNQRFLVDQTSVIQFGPLPTESPYSPSIDQVMMDMADRFGQRCTGIIFSGMASDAIEGAKYLAARGAKVWVQDPATCVISSMIDGAQAAGVVSFVGAPEQLADHVLDDLGVLT
jgi:chemosensory pili system protein ChpB (putative protein-glutamate methylesterase)